MKTYLRPLFAAAIAFTITAASASEKTNVVGTSSGPVQGTVDGPVAKFLGIPFAAPPIGALRWQPPRDPPSWTQTLVAEKFGSACAQPGLGAFAAPSDAEDCLYINVFAPKDLPSSDGRPVMIWFYGGGLFAGASNDYDGGKLAAQGDVVVVTFNYRLGAFGFFSHPAIDGEGHPFANYGIMDQQFALQWVRRNIAAFGGDPRNVTIFGQSAGAASVIANLVSPLSAGLFHRAIIQSSSALRPSVPATVMTKAAQDFAAAAGCADQSAACLRSLPAATILARQWPVVLIAANNSLLVDGTVMTQPTLDAFKTGHFNRTPILTGITRDEQAFFMPETNIAPVPNAGKPLNADEYDRFLTTFGPAFTDKLRVRYPITDFPSPSVAQIEVTQKSRVCGARISDELWSRHVPVYAYQFNDRTAPSYFKPLSYPMGAYHTSELQYLFPFFPISAGTAPPLNAAQSVLSDRMISLWANFARTGVPSADWAPYSAAKANVMVLDLPAPKMISNYGEDADCELWDSILAPSR